MIKCTDLTRKFILIPAAAYTAGTTFTVAHGLGYAPSVLSCSVRSISTTASGVSDVVDFGVVSADATNVTIKPGRTTTSGVLTSGYLVIELDRDLGGRPSLVA